MASGKRSGCVVFVRCSPRLKAMLEEKALTNHRSVNQEACLALERHVKDAYRLSLGADAQ